MTNPSRRRHTVVAWADYGFVRGREGAESMAVYRIYLVHDDGRLEPDESFYCKTDEEAVARLRPPGRVDVRAELWQGGRFIAIAGSLRRSGAEGRPQAVP